MGYEPPPLGELAEAFTNFAEGVVSANKELREQIERLQGRAVALELVVKALVTEGNTGYDLLRVVLRELDREFTEAVGPSSPHVEAAAGFVSTLLELLPDPKPERRRELPEPSVEPEAAAESPRSVDRLDSAAPCRLQ